MAGDAAYSRDWLLGGPAAQRPELSAPLHLKGGGPRQPRRAQLGTQAGRGLPGQLRVAGRPPGELGGPLLDLLRRQGLPGQAELRGPQAGDLLAEDPGRGRGLRARAARPAARSSPPPGCSPIRRKPLISRASSATMRRSVASIRLIRGPDRGAADRGYGRHLQLADPGEGAVDAAQGGVPVLLRRIAGRPRPGGRARPRSRSGGAGPPGDGGAAPAVAVGLVAGRDEQPGQLVVQGVPGRGGVQGDERDAVGDLQVNQPGWLRYRSPAHHAVPLRTGSVLDPF